MPLAILLSIALLALLTAAASGQYEHIGSFANEGAADGQLRDPERADVYFETGHLFIANKGNDRIEVFAPSGNSAVFHDNFTAPGLDDPLGVAVDQTDGSIYVSDADDILKFDSEYNVDDSFTSPGITGALAVDPTDGDLLVADKSANVVKRFDADGTPDGASPIDGSTSPAGEFTGLLDIAVNSEGDIYVVDADGPIQSGPSGTPFPSGHSRVERFGPAGAHKATLTPVGPNQRPATVAVDLSNDTVVVSGEQDAIYRDAEATLHVFDSSNTPLQEFELDQGPPFISVAGMAADSSRERLYVVHDAAYWSDGGSYGARAGVLVFQAVTVTPPTVATAPASDITQDGATLNGTVNPEGSQVTACVFDYVSEDQYQVDGFASAQSVPCNALPGAGTSPVAVAAQVSGLASDTDYRFRLRASNGGGSNTSDPETFRTAVPTHFPPSAALSPVSEVTSTTAKLAGQVTPNGLETTYRFEYRQAGSSEWREADSGNAGSAQEAVGVEAELKHLIPVTDYEARLIAENEHGTATSSIREFATPAGAPVVVTRSAIDVDGTTARLRARINPGGRQTSFYFEYGTDTTYGWRIPSSGAAIGTGNATIDVARKVTGLEPGVTYHFRVVAENALGRSEGEDASFTTSASAQDCPNAQIRAIQRASAIADCRAWELVSPPDKNGGDVLVNPTRTRISASESEDLPRAAMFASLAGFADARGSGITFEYVSERTAKPGTQGWETHAVTPPQDPMPFAALGNGVVPHYVDDADPMLTKAIFRSWSPLDAAENTQHFTNLYARTDLRTPGDGEYVRLTDSVDPVPFRPFNARNFFRAYVADVSADASTVLFEARDRLTADAPAGLNPKAYFATADGVSFAGLIPGEGQTSCTGSECEPASPATAVSAGIGAGRSANTYYLPNTLSADGQRAVITVGPPDSTGTRGNIYVRDTQGTPDPSDDTTTQVNASELESPEQAKPARYWNASTDGRAVVFETNERLIPGDSDDDTNLYVWSEQAGAGGSHLELIDRDEQPADGRASLLGVIGVSDDASIVYFASRGQLVADEPPLGATVGIYVWRRGSGLTYLGASDGDNIGRAIPGTSGVHNQLGARVSPDGEHLLLSLDKPPTPNGPDHGMACETVPPNPEPAPCRELYLFDLTQPEPEPMCVSCPEDGLPRSHADYHIRYNSGGATSTTHLNHPLADDGSRVFFSSADPLVAEDRNGVYDAYMWEEAGSGSCTSAEVNGGCLSLISSGKSDQPSFFVEASPDGEDVLFITSEQLVGWDRDQSQDLYTARVDGGFAEPAAPREPCDSLPKCRGDEVTGPADEQVGSGEYVGPSNGAAHGARCVRLKKRLSLAQRRLRAAQRRVQRSDGRRARARSRVARAKERVRTTRKALASCRRAGA